VTGAGTVHLGADLDGLTDYAGALATGRLPADPFVLLGQMTTADPTRSPAGTETVWAYTHLPRRLAGEADAVATQLARIEALLERHAPGFARLIVHRSVQGPAQLAAADANLDGGAIGGGTAAAHQQLVFRPVPGTARAETPVERLYLASSSAHPGAGVHGACGANAARAALLANARGPAARLRAATARRVLRAVQPP
jgi:phytoene dehydrogenase-like protein